MLPKIHGLLGKILTLDGSYLNKCLGKVGIFTNKKLIFLANTFNKNSKL